MEDPASGTTKPQRPQLPPRANTDRGARSASLHASFRAPGSMRDVFVRLASMPEEPRAPAVRPARSNTVASRMQSMRFGPQTSVRPFVRAMSSMLRSRSMTTEAPAEETFRCHICFDDVVASEAVALASCGHKYCASCFKPYLELKITEGNVYPVCFHPVENAEGSADATCGVAVTQDQIQQIVAPEVYTKYEYFRFNKEHQHARECPYCAHSQDCAGPENPVCVCVQCEKSFCFFHGNAHEDGTCADYELKNAHEESLNRAKIDEISKPCPGCHRDVEKNGGCNHMKCIGCNTNFCWLCGEIIEDAPLPSHYAADNGGSCSGMQFDGMEQEQTRLSPWQWPIAIIIAILAFVPALVIAVVGAPLMWLCDRRKDFWELFGGLLGGSYVVFCMLLGLVFMPVGWVIDICVGIITIIVLIIATILERCFRCCCRSRRPATETDAPVVNDLEAGLVDAPAANGENGSAGQGETRSYAV